MNDKFAIIPHILFSSRNFYHVSSGSSYMSVCWRKYLYANKNQTCLKDYSCLHWYSFIVSRIYCLSYNCFVFFLFNFIVISSVSHSRSIKKKTNKEINFWKNFIAFCFCSYSFMDLYWRLVGWRQCYMRNVKYDKPKWHDHFTNMQLYVIKNVLMYQICNI